MVLQTAELPYITRVVPPKRRGFKIRRRHLLEVMKARVNRRVQIVSGPAGYGKTSLLVDLADEANFPVCWYSFAPEDSDPTILLRYCLQAIRNHIEDFGVDYVAHSLDSYQADWRIGLGLFINALQNEVPGRLIFVFDDVHWINGKAEMEQALSLLVQRAPNNIHFVLGSRAWPSLECLPKLAVDDEISSIDTGDLRFSDDETCELLGRLWDKDVALAEAIEVNSRTKGWPAAIMLTAKNGQATAVPYIEKSSDEGILFGYLSNEIFDKQPESLKYFLLRASILREFTTNQCSRLFNLEHAQTTIDQIKELGLFLDERVGNESVYAFHDLFRNFLENRYKTGNPAEHREMHNAAAEYFSELEDYESVIHHFVESGNCSEALDAIKAVAGSYYSQGRWQTLESLLNRLPKNALEGDQELLLLSGQLLIRTGNPTEALTCLDRLIGKAECDGRETMGNALVAKSTAYRRLGHLDLAASAAKQGLEVLLEIDCSPDLIAEAHKQLGDSYGTQGEFELAKEHFHAGLGLINKGNLRLHSLICNDLGVTYLELGELGQAAVHLEQAQAGLTKLGSQGPLADTLTNLALVYFHQGEFDLALDEIQRAIAIAQEADYPRVLTTGLMNRAMFQGAIGNYSDALSSAVQALDMSKELLDQRLVAESTNVLGDAYRKVGEVSKAEILLNQALIEAGNSGQRYIAATYNITLGKVYCQIGSYPQALESLGVAEEQLTELKSLRRLAEVTLYQAAAFYRSGKIKEALACLVRTKELCPEDSFDGFLLADSSELLDVLRFGMAKRVGWEGFASLVARISADHTSENFVQTVQDKTNLTLRLPDIRVCSFGGTRVWLDAHEITDGEWRSKKAKELFFYLLAKKRSVSNEEILEALWPDFSLELSSSAMKTNVYRLRQALFFDCIQVNDSGYCINPAVSVAFDVDDFRKCLKSAVASKLSREDRQQYLLQAVELHEGPFLGGYDSEWCDELRSDLEARYHAALMHLSSYQAAGGNFQQAVELLEKVIEADPYNEEAQYQCIQNYVNCEEPYIALQKLRKFAKLSVEELGCNLPPRFFECHKRITQLLPNQT